MPQMWDYLPKSSLRISLLLADARRADAQEGGKMKTKRAKKIQPAVKTNKSKKFTKAQVKKLKEYWKIMRSIQDRYFENIDILNETMAKDLKINELEFFVNQEGEICGIGNQYGEPRYKLIQQEKLEK